MPTRTNMKSLSTAALLVFTTAAALAQSHHYNGPDDSFLPNPVRMVSTVPSNGDVNPYGVAFINNNFQTGSGPLQHGDILVSNFNNAQNLQGTGTTIIRVPKTGAPTTFFQGQPGLGLTTALGVLQYGFVLVGNMPTTDGTFATVKPGSLLVINNQGKLIQSFSGAGIDGPWDMTLVDDGDRVRVFIANALNGTVTRLDFDVSPSAGLYLVSTVTVASGYLHRGDPAALVVGPTGLVFDRDRDILYVASTGDNAVFAVHGAYYASSSPGQGEIVYQDNAHLHGPTAMAMTPNHHLLAASSDVINVDPNQPSEIVEFTTDGQFVNELSVDPNLGGSFGLAIHNMADQSTFAAVDDNTSSLTIWQLNQQ